MQLTERFCCPGSSAHCDLHSFPTRRSSDLRAGPELRGGRTRAGDRGRTNGGNHEARRAGRRVRLAGRSEEHTSELQSHVNLVCRLLLEKKKRIKAGSISGTASVGLAAATPG